MSAEFQRIKDIFLAALEKDAGAPRLSYLDEVCGQDIELKQRVEALLARHEAAGSFLESPAPALPPTTDEPATERPGTVIGPYKLLQQIGEGGMGTVYMAEQTQPVQRKVALKIIKPGMDSRQIIARFEAERQALALMDHPNIARVLDAGATGTGRPYFVMELVKGNPITKYCDEHHLSPRERLDLFVPVCQAVQHAHQKGIIHRDLKPSNVLIALYDGKPVPKVIDFGVAKAMGQKLTEETLFTQFGQVVGTLEYMSPEQAEPNQLDIDTRSDIYSLGVLLYELLTGTTPIQRKRLKEAAILEALRIIREEEPPKPSTRLSTTEELPSIAANRGLEPKKLSGLVRGELDWIVMKALEKDRNRRYETANGLAMDLQRYLADEPVLAGPPSNSYRLKKFVRRNRGSVMAVAVVILALVVGIVGTTLGLIEARRQRDAAETAATAEKQAKETAQEREGETKAVLEFVESKVFAAARPKDEEGGQGFDVKLADAVRAALPFLDKSFTDQPLIEGRLRMTMGNSFLYLGDANAASEQFQAARRLFTEHRGADHPDTLRAMCRLARSYQDLGRNTDAVKLYEEALTVMKVKLPDDPLTLGSMNNLANSYGNLGRHAEGLKLLEETLALQTAKLGPDHRSTLGTMTNLGIVYGIVGRHDDARKLLEKTLALMKAKIPNDRFRLNCMDSLAGIYADLGRHADALKLHEEALALIKARLGPGHPDTLEIMYGLANDYGSLGRTQEALKLREETFQLQKSNLGPDHPATLKSMVNLANSYDAAGRTQEALRLREETLPLMKAKHGLDHPDTLTSMNNLASSYISVGSVARAMAILQDALALHERRVKVDPGNSWEVSNLAWTHGQIGEAEQARLNFASAVQAYAKSVEMFDKLDQTGALKQYFRGELNSDRERLALCRKAEQAVKDLDFALQQPAAEVPRLLDMRVRYLMKEQKLAAAVESAAKMKEHAGDKSEQLYNAARAYALCAGAAKDAKKPVANVPGPEELAREAMTLLKQAVARGFKNAAHMKQDNDLNGLREREDFKKLLTELEAKAKP
jgi:serine/threonine protein kinase/tetratricopeptide (TPR) repeat protein